MNHTDIAGERLRGQGISGAPFATISEVVAWHGAMQSQEYAVAKWSVGQRATGLTDADLDGALADATIVRTHVLRPTWHFVAAADIRWMLALTAPRVQAAAASYYRKYGLDEGAFARSAALLVDALSGGVQLTRKQLTALYVDNGFEVDNLVVGFLLIQAELDAVICSGGLSGKQRTYALFDERVPPAPPRDRDDALAELARRYFISHGPATLDDYRWWSGLTAGDARQGIELAGADLERVVINEQAYWRGTAPPPGTPDPSPTVHLLQAYDEYIVAYRGSRGVFDTAGLTTARQTGVRPFLNAIILDGQYAGTWQRKLTVKHADIEVQLARRFTRAERDALTDAVERHGKFVGAQPRLTVRSPGD